MRWEIPDNIALTHYFQFFLFLKLFQSSWKHFQTNFQAKSGREFLVVNEAWSGKNLSPLMLVITFLRFMESAFVPSSHNTQLLPVDQNKSCYTGVKHPGDHIKFSLLGDYDQVLDLCRVQICALLKWPEKRVNVSKLVSSGGWRSDPGVEGDSAGERCCPRMSSIEMFIGTSLKLIKWEVLK